MKPFPKPNVQLTKMAGSTMLVVALAASFATPAFAELSILNEAVREWQPEKQKVEKPKARPVERREERRDEGREGRRDDRHYDRQPERRFERIENRHERRIHRAPVWHGDIRYFERHDLPRWRSGAWRHSRHDGRLGWWWVVGGLWYFYPQPIYPYPDPYMPPVVITQYEPVQSTPDIVVAPAVASQSWYYCESADGYYPYTPTCPEGWKTVPATPPANSSAVPTQ